MAELYQVFEGGEPIAMMVGELNLPGAVIASSGEGGGADPDLPGCRARFCLPFFLDQEGLSDRHINDGSMGHLSVVTPSLSCVENFGSADFECVWEWGSKPGTGTSFRPRV